MSESKAFPLLAQPVKLGAIQATNRVLMASLTRNRAVGKQDCLEVCYRIDLSQTSPSTDTIPNEENVKYYAQRAKAGGAGLILTEGTLICHQGTEWPHAAGLWDEEHAEGWRKVVEAVHKEGVPIVVQLWHVGRVAHPDQEEQKKSGRPVYAPSAVAARGGKVSS
jgi:2,4-dienoyl-CoA reductase-like NADH-dependent reductase (Old Yellow Enzyme family)